MRNEEHFICLNCGAALIQRHCKVRCMRCGYFEDCSDGGLDHPNRATLSNFSPEISAGLLHPRV